MLNKKVFLEAIDALEQKGISREITIKALTEAFETIVKKKHVDGLPDLMVSVTIKPEEGIIDIFNLKNIVSEVTDDAIEISLEEAKELDPNAEIGGQVSIKIDVDDFTVPEAKKFKSILTQKIKEAEKQAILSIYADKVDEIITGHVEKIEQNYTLVNIDRTSVVLSNKEKIGDETFNIGQPIKVYLSGVGSSTDSGILISRACPGFLKRLFEEEIHDVYDGTVIIKDIAREAGERSKVSVMTNDINVDPVGACIGQGGSKIQKICSQINREKIDVIQYHQHKGLFIVECLKPAVVLGVKMNEDGSAVAIINDGDLRVAIGRRGVNARLAVRLAGCKIDIKEKSVAESEGIIYDTVDVMKKQEEEMIFEARRKSLLEQIRLDEEKRKQEEAAAEAKKALEALNPVEVDEEEEELEEVEEIHEKEEVVEKEVIETPKEVAEEKPVEFKPIFVQPKVSLADLEKQIEEEKKKKANQNNSSSRKKAKPEEKVEEKKETKARMDIYTQEELDELDAEDEEEYIEDEDIDYDDYDEYYEDN